MTGITVNPLASTVWNIRRGATLSFKAGLEQLAEEEKVTILNDIQLLSAGTSKGSTKKTVVDSKPTSEGYIKQSD